MFEESKISVAADPKFNDVGCSSTATRSKPGVEKGENTTENDKYIETQTWFVGCLIARLVGVRVL